MSASSLSHRSAILLLIVVVLAWGCNWPVNKLVLDTLSPLWLAALRSAIATVALFALAVALSGRPPAWPHRADYPVVLSITLLHMVGFGALVSLGLQLVPAGRSVVLAYTTPLWVVPGARLFLGEALTGRRLLGVTLGLGGLLVLFNPLTFDWADRTALLGNLALLAGALLWAGSILHNRAHRWQATPFELLPWETALATILLTLLAAAFEPVPTGPWTGQLILLLLYGAIPGTVVAYWAIAMANRALPAMTVALGLLATPAVSIVIAAVMLGEPITLPLICALALIVGGIAVGASSPAARSGGGR